MSGTGAAVAGWYPDPYDPAQLRYWDGQTWSEATAPANPVAGGGPAAPAAVWYQASPGYPGAIAPVGTGLGDVGDWLGDLFRALVNRAVPVGVLLFGLPAVGTVLFLLAGWSAVANLQYDSVAERVTGFNVGAAVLAAAVAVAWMVLWAFCWLASNHQLYYAHLDQSVSFGRSLVASVVRMPRMILWGLVMGFGMAVVFGTLYALPLVLAAATGKASFLALFFVTIPLLVVVAFWLGVRLVHVWMAVAVGPKGTNPISTSLSLTKDRWLAHLGRLLLLGVIVWLISFVVQFIINIAVQSTVLSQFSIDPVTSELQLNGQNLTDIDVFVVRDFLPGLPTVIVLGLLYTLNQGFSQALMLSGMAGLYRRAGGPAEITE
jgi:Protein of unknown function (DUF2510)